MQECPPLSPPLSEASENSGCVHRLTAPAMLKKLAAGIVLGAVIGIVAYPHAGFDWYTHFSVYSDAPITSVQYLPWLYLILSPIARLPNSFAWFTLFNGALLIASLYLIEQPDYSNLVVLPFFWILFYGQIDMWVVFGASLGLWALERRRPYWVGLALVMLTAKIHVGTPLGLYYLWRSRDWRALVVPIGALVLSCVLFGFWPPPFIRSITSLPLDTFTTQSVNVSLWPWSLALLPLLLWNWSGRTLRQQATGILAATALILPYCPIYSLAPLTLLASEGTGWALLLFPAWFGSAWSSMSGSFFCVASLLKTLVPQVVEALRWRRPIS